MFFDQYNYIDYPDPNSYETEEDYQEDVDHWLGKKDSINIESQVITQNSIDKYGKQFFIDFINTKDLLKWQLLYKKI